MKEKILYAVIPIVLLTSVPVCGVYAGALAAWKPVDWGAVDGEIERRKDTGENIDVVTGAGMEVPAATLNQLAGKNVTLALHTGDGIAVSASGREFGGTEHNLRISLNRREMIPEELRREAENGALRSQAFAMEEKDAYDVRLNIHFHLGGEYAGKYANLYRYEEGFGTLACDASFRVTNTGMAMFPLYRGDEYLLTVTDSLPVGGKLSYTVAEGDCLSKIADAHGVRVKDLMEVNPKIEDADRIRTGQELLIVKR